MTIPEITIVAALVAAFIYYLDRRFPGKPAERVLSTDEQTTAAHLAERMRVMQAATESRSTPPAVAPLNPEVIALFEEVLRTPRSQMVFTRKRDVRQPAEWIHTTETLYITLLSRPDAVIRITKHDSHGWTGCKFHTDNYVSLYIRGWARNRELIHPELATWFARIEDTL